MNISFVNVYISIIVTSGKIFLNRRHNKERSRYHSISGMMCRSVLPLKAVESIRRAVIEIVRDFPIPDATVHGYKKNSKLNITVDRDVGY